MTEQVLEQERKTYEAHRDELLAKASGKFALVHGDEIVEVLDTKADAITSGYKHFGNSPFLVKGIVAVEAPQNFVSNHLAV
ncbi:MAG TPA: hypothetical protein VII10_09495 [Reyranella sp.]